MLNKETQSYGNYFTFDRAQTACPAAASTVVRSSMLASTATIGRVRFPVAVHGPSASVAVMPSCSVQGTRWCFG